MSTKVKIILLLMSLSLTLCMMSNTYSRYVAGTTGNVEMKFAAWQILVNETDITAGNTTSINLTPVIKNNKHVAANKLAPSSIGYFDINVNPTNVDLSFNYKVDLAINNENMPDIMITKYALLDTVSTQSDDEVLIPVTGNAIVGSLDYDNSVKNFQFKPFTIRIYFEWYEGENELMNDEQDTMVASAADENVLNITANITFEQKFDNVATPTDEVIATPSDEI